MRDRPPPRSQAIFRILLLLATLVAVVVTQRRCASGADALLKAFDPPRPASRPFERPPRDGGADARR